MLERALHEIARANVTGVRTARVNVLADAPESRGSTSSSQPQSELINGAYYYATYTLCQRGRGSVATLGWQSGAVTETTAPDAKRIALFARDDRKGDLFLIASPLPGKPASARRPLTGSRA